jgi:HEAT repeats
VAIRLTVLVVLGATLGGPPAARAHVVYGTPSLRQLTRDADVVARVRIQNARRVLRSADPPLVRPVVDAVVLETLRGERTSRVTFVPHGHGAAEYDAGEEALVFLWRLGRVPELAATPLSGRVSWASIQETSDKITLSARTRRMWLDATRRYVRVEASRDSTQRSIALRDTTLALLGSPEPRIAASALRDLATAGDAAVLTADDLPRLETLLERDATPMTVRVGLLAELERRGLVESPPRWARLLERARARDRLVVIRAVATHPSAAVTVKLARIAEDRDPDAAAAAAVSLGTPGNVDAVPVLERLVGRDEGRLRFAAIRGLGRIGSQDSMAALRRAAAFHPDQATRRRAAAEVTVLDRGAVSATGRSQTGAAAVSDSPE